jgi:hypothetical protein
MPFHIDQQANGWWKDDQMIAKFADLWKGETRKEG